MQKLQLSQINTIQLRVNSKMVSMNNRYFLLGGITTSAITNHIYEYRLLEDNQKLSIEWKPLAFIPNLFKPCNSFSACAGEGLIFIWGGLQVEGQTQNTLNDLIEVNVDKHTMRTLPLKNKIAIHSSVLFYDLGTLIAYGGTNENSQHPALLYTLDLKGQSYEWQTYQIECAEHQGCVWQHTGHLSNRSLLGKGDGKFMVVVGGCKTPCSPFPVIVEIDLQQKKVVGKLKLPIGLVSHESLLITDRLLIFGGSVGGDFNRSVYILKDGKLQTHQGFMSIGCCGCCVRKIGPYQNIIVLNGGAQGMQMMMAGTTVMKLTKE